MKLGLTADEVLTTTRAVRKRLDFARPVEREVILECLEIALQVSTGDAGPSVIGHLRADPPAPVVVTAESSSGQVLPPATADPRGRFFFPDLPPGSVRLRCTRSGSRPVVTPWVALGSSSGS